MDTPMRTSRKIRRRKMRPDTAYTTAEVKEIETLARPGADILPQSPGPVVRSPVLV